MTDEETIERLRADLEEASTMPRFTVSVSEAQALLRALDAAEAKASGEWCVENRAAGRGPCGACARCCHQATERAEQAERERDALRIAVEDLRDDAEAAQGLDEIRADEERRLRTESAALRAEVLALREVAKAARALQRCPDHAEACCYDWCEACRQELGSRGSLNAALDRLTEESNGA